MYKTKDLRPGAHKDRSIITCRPFDWLQLDRHCGTLDDIVQPEETYFDCSFLQFGVILSKSEVIVLKTDWRSLQGGYVTSIIRFRSPDRNMNYPFKSFCQRAGSRRWALWNTLHYSYHGERAKPFFSGHLNLLTQSPHPIRLSISAMTPKLTFWFMALTHWRGCISPIFQLKSPIGFLPNTSWLTLTRLTLCSALRKAAFNKSRQSHWHPHSHSWSDKRLVWLPGWYSWFALCERCWLRPGSSHKESSVAANPIRLSRQAKLKHLFVCIQMLNFVVTC